MPLVKIDMVKNVRAPEEVKQLADVVQEVLLQKFNAPPRDRYSPLFYSPLLPSDETLSTDTKS
jgi:hypothetical protein